MVRVGTRAWSDGGRTLITDNISSLRAKWGLLTDDLVSQRSYRVFFARAYRNKWAPIAGDMGEGK